MKIKALVLTFDQNRVATENMIFQYEKLLGKDQFRYVIPYQDNDVISDSIESEVELVFSESAIMKTIRTLLDSVDGDEIVYWCIDDKYPIEIDQIRFRKTVELIDNSVDIDGISLAMARRLLVGDGIQQRAQSFPGFEELKLHRRTNFNQFWLHQFMRADCLRYVFGRMPDDIERAREMDFYLDRIEDNPFQMFVSQENYICFGESMDDGKFTKNFLEVCRANQISIPAERAVLEEKEIEIGIMNQRVNRHFRWLGLRGPKKRYRPASMTMK